MTTEVTETQTAVAEAPKPSLQDLLDQYVTLKAGRDAKTVSPEDFDNQSRTLRRKIRAAGGSVNSLKPDAPPAEAKAPKEPKAKKSKKAGANVEAGLAGDPKAQPAGLAHVNWLIKVFSGEERLPEDPQVTPMTERSVQDLEASGDYGFGIDVLSDILPRASVGRFIERFGYEPTWFCMHKPDSYEIPTALTLMILGPAPTGDTGAASSEEAVAPDEPGTEDAAQDHVEGEEDEDEWGDEDETE